MSDRTMNRHLAKTALCVIEAAYHYAVASDEIVATVALEDWLKRARVEYRKATK